MSGSALQVQSTARRASRVTRGSFESVPILVARTDDGCWVDWAPIPDLIGWNESRTLYHKRVALQVEHDGRLVTWDFVRRSDFLSAAVINDRFPALRAYVVGLLEELEDRGVVLSPEFSGDTVLQMLQGLTQTRIDVLRTQQRQGELERDLVKLDGKVDTLLDVVDHGKQYTFALVWLGNKGVRVPEGMKSAVGSEIKKLAMERFGYDADSHPKQPLGRFFVYVYPLAILEKVGATWIEQNRRKPERSAWFRP